jgi:hypothetical protein
VWVQMAGSASTWSSRGEGGNYCPVLGAYNDVWMHDLDDDSSDLVDQGDFSRVAERVRAGAEVDCHRIPQGFGNRIVGNVSPVLGTLDAFPVPLSVVPIYYMIVAISFISAQEIAGACWHRGAGCTDAGPTIEPPHQLALSLLPPAVRARPPDRRRRLRFLVRRGGRRVGVGGNRGGGSPDESGHCEDADDANGCSPRHGSDSVSRGQGHDDIHFGCG